MAPDPRVVKAKLAEIERRYRRKRGKRARPSLAALRVYDLNRLMTARHGEVLSDDDAGLDDIKVMAHHLAAMSGDPRKRINDWLRLRAPWLSFAEAEVVLADAILRPQRWRADKLAWRMQLTEVDRRTLGITTIGAIDLTKAERAKRRKLRARARERERRQAAGKLTRAEYLAKSVSRAKPWSALGMSRAAWYRAGKPSA